MTDANHADAEAEVRKIIAANLGRAVKAVPAQAGRATATAAAHAIASTATLVPSHVAVFRGQVIRQRG